MIDIIDNREEGDTSLRQAQLIMIKLLKSFHNICVKNSLSYWLDSGTLLGAVRHKGFIPWDDDIDICMPRGDYNILMKIANEQLPKDILFQHNKNSLKKWKWIKLRDKYSSFIQKSDLNKDIQYHQGVFIDIFPSDLIHKDHNTAKRILNRRYRKQKGKYIKILGSFIDLFSLIPIHVLRYNNVKNALIKYYSSDNYKYITKGIEVCLSYKIHKRETVFPLKKIRFEDDYFFAPNNSHQYLIDLFGDYMVLPPKNKREFHAAEIKPFTPCNHNDVLYWDKRKEKI